MYLRRLHPRRFVRCSCNNRHVSDAGCASTRTYRVKTRLGTRARYRYTRCFINLFQYKFGTPFSKRHRVFSLCTIFIYLLFSSCLSLCDAFLRSFVRPLSFHQLDIYLIYQSLTIDANKRANLERISKRKGQSKWPPMARLQAENLSGAGDRD